MQYTEEEKRAIDILNDFQFRSRTIMYNKIDFEDVESVKIVLNLLEKQQKEIEELKGITQSYNSFVAQVSIPKNQIVVVGDKRYFDCGYFIERYIPKEVIREKIEELEKLIRDIANNDEYSHEIPLYKHDIQLLKEILGDE